MTACTTSYATNAYPDLRAECNALQNYVLLCQTEGLAMSGWREDTSCSEFSLATEVIRFLVPGSDLLDDTHDSMQNHGPEVLISD